MVGSEAHFYKPGISKFFIKRQSRYFGLCGPKGKLRVLIGSYREKTNFHKVLIDGLQNTVTTEYILFF